MKSQFKLAVALSTLITSALSFGTADVQAQQSRPDAEKAMSTCKLQSDAEALAVLICEKGWTEKSLRDAGKSVCGARTLCNVWIWDDAAKAPKNSPKKDADIAKTEAAAAAAVWANDSQSLLVLSKVRR